VIVTFRPEFEPSWIGRPCVTALTLNRLAQREVDTMIDRVVGNKLIPANIRQGIIERTDGIPLFVEEMTKAVSLSIQHRNGAHRRAMAAANAQWKAEKRETAARYLSEICKVLVMRNA
jgi:predicted ATPase